MDKKTKSDSITLITDPLIEPFYISKDQYCYTVLENITSSESNNQYQKVLGHYSDLAGCLKQIIQSKVDKKGDYLSIKSYINEWNEIKNELKQILQL
jgi:hypothetical protein